MTTAVMPVAISLVMAIAAGAGVWVMWSVIENLAAARRAKRAAPPAATEDPGATS